MLTPRLDRGDFLSQLRRDPAIARMPVIFYTDGYLEIASGRARDVERLLTPILLCQEAIRGTVQDEDIGSLAPLKPEKKKEQSESKNVQEVFTFVCESGAERLRIRPAELIGRVVDDARATFPSSIEITSAYSEDLWLIEGDQRELHRVLSNLFLNSRAAMPQGGSLLVWARNFDIDQRYASMTMGAKPGRYVMLRVSDTGRGTARPMIDNIFSPFLERRQIGAGTNLGLIKSHGGFMSVYSNMDKGTTFQIFLPAAVVEDRKSTPTEQGAAAIDSYLLLSA
jgi:signal transduction histidine kinase